MVPRETENNAYAKFLGDKQGVLWYVMVFSGVVNSAARTYFTHIWEYPPGFSVICALLIWQGDS